VRVISNGEAIGLYTEAIVKWGAPAQWRMVQEEAAELIAAINRLCRGRASIDDVAEEVADMAIMVGQAALLVDPDRFEAHVCAKLARLKARLHEDVTP